MLSYKRVSNLTGWLVFLITFAVFFMSAERTGSLWDCGEFILGAYKLQVVHPPGAPVFLLVGRMFAWMAELVSDDPQDIAFAVNLLSGICTAFAAMFVAWVTIILGKMALVGREEEPEKGQLVALAGAGLVAGLATAFSTSIWFSAVEGEVYAMSTFFTTMTLWATIHWYAQPNEHQYDRWLIFALYASGMSIGVHLLSILTFPALTFFFYLKRYQKHTFGGVVAAAAIGVAMIVAIQSLIITGLPKLWGRLELVLVNGIGLPINSGLILLLLLVVGGVVFGLRYAEQKQNPTLQNGIIATALIIISYASYGMVVTRAHASPPINMNTPTDAMRLISYLNREQYGDRALLRGPHFEASPIDVKSEQRYGRVGDRYEIVDEKLSYVFDKRQETIFPRMSDNSQGRPALYKQWIGMDPNQPLPPGRPTLGDNIRFFVSYQLNWMYWRYFMWNFSGRQNGEQGYYSWDKSSGNWISGIPFIDNARLGGDLAKMPDSLKDKAMNKYFMLPLLFGLFGVFFQFNRRPKEWLGVLAFFVITGIGIIVYANQPPNEPRERDYVFVGSFFTFCIWIGLGVLALFEFLRARIKMPSVASGAAASLIVLSAPFLMGTQNFDDMDRSEHFAARDYASNFLQSCAPNAILFTFGDNDTYPLWYAQEVEGIRKDVRVVNLSLIAVDWYINLLRRKVNDSPAIKLSIPEDALRGNRRNQVFYASQTPGVPDREMSLADMIKFVGEYHPLPLQNGSQTDSYIPSKNVYLPVDREAAVKAGLIAPGDTSVVDRIPLNISGEFLTKDDLAVLDIIASNLWERPIYFSVTTRQDKFFGLDDYMRLEGLGLRITPSRGQSDPGLGIIGSGRVDTDLFYKNVTEKFRWGNFDKVETFVDKSYLASVQSMQLSMRRAAGELLRENKKDKAIVLADLYFKAFPHKNFPYDYRAYYMVDIYLEAGAYEKAKPIMKVIADETEKQAAYLTSLDPTILASSYQDRYNLALQNMNKLMQDAQRNKDDAFFSELQQRFARFRVKTPEDTLPIQ
jgi:hypothetical protein